MQTRAIQTGAALVLISVAVLVCFRSLVRHPRDIVVGPQRLGWNDLTTYFIPVHSYPGQCLREHRQPPWWNPLRAGGTPHLGNPQSALFYPPNWLCYLCDPAHVLSWLLVLHHGVAGAGAYVLCRRCGFGWVASALGGSLFGTAPYLLAQSGEGHYAQICAVAWMPWALVAYESCRAGSKSGMVGLAVVLAMSFLAGHPQELYYLVVILTARVVVDAWQAYRGHGVVDAVRGLLSYGLTVVLTVALVAVELIPMAQYVRESSRSSALSGAKAGAIAMNLPNLLQLLDPFALGGPGTYGGEDKFFWETLCSFGITALVLAIIGAVGAWNVPGIRFLTMAGLVAFLFGFGAGSPVFLGLFHGVPGAGFFRVPSRTLFFCSLVVALFAAGGIDSIWRLGDGGANRLGRMVRGVLIVICIGCLGVLLILRVSEAGKSKKDGTRLETAVSRPETAAGEQAQESTDRRSLIVRRALNRTLGSSTPYGWLLLTCACMLLGLSRMRWAAAAAIGLWALSVAQSGVCAGRLLTTLPVSEFRQTGTLASELKANLGMYRVLTPTEFLPDHVAQSLGIAKLQSYDPLPLARRTEFFRVLTGRTDPTSVEIGGSSVELDKLRESLLDLSNVHHIVQHSNRATDPLDEFRWIRVSEGLEEPFHLQPWVATSSPYSLFQNSDVLPRAYAVGQTRVSGKDEDVAAAMAELRPREEAMLTAEFLPPGPRCDYTPARIVEYTPNRVVVEAELTAVGYLVLCDTWYPGWMAKDNGLPTSVIPANLMFRAVPLSAGKHQVVFEYRPVGLVSGVLVSAAAWVGLAGSMLSSVVRRRRV